MADTIGNLMVSHDMVVTPPKQELGFAVSNTDWELIKGCINDINTTPSHLHSGGWFLLGTAVAFLISALTCSGTQQLLFFVTTIAFAICGAIALYSCSVLGKIELRTKQHAIAVMDKIMKKYNA